MLSSLDISPYMVQRVKNTKENQKGLAASVFVLCLPQRKRVESADGKGSVDETEANKAHSHEQVVGSFFGTLAASHGKEAGILPFIV